jgi:hypothetical protein
VAVIAGISVRLNALMKVIQRSAGRLTGSGPGTGGLFRA